MSSVIRMNQKIPQAEDPELFQYLSQFPDRGRAYQARKLMLLGLVQLGRLNGQKMAVDSGTASNAHSLTQASNAGMKSEYDLIADAGVAELF